jgi:hypothetical protein
MKVQCVTRYPNEDGLSQLGPEFFREQSFGVKVGAEYVVLGMFIANGRPPFGKGPWIEFKNVDDRFGVAPLVIFEITDHRLSKYWEVHILQNGVLSIAPPSFNKDFYMEDYYDGVPEVVDDFNRISRLREEETLGNEA